MFKQFIEYSEANQIYLLCSLAIFLIFFITVCVLLLTMKKEEVKYMSELPLTNE